MAKTALIVVDVQKCFCPNGELPVTDGDKIVEPANRAVKHAKERGWLILFSRDWHRKESEHFRKWPVHGVQNTDGARFHPGLEIPDDAIIISKGMEIHEDAYSAFDGFAFVRYATEQVEFYEKKKLNSVLFDAEVDTLYICGLATDYCVKATVLSARSYGYKTIVLLDACKGVELYDGDVAKAISDMNRAGAEFTSVAGLVADKK